MNITIESLSKNLSSYLTKEDINVIRNAYDFAEQAHQNQTRKSGEAYIIHPLEVAHILYTLKLDKESIMSALLHDVVEDTHFNKADIATKFGKQIAEIVDGVSKIDNLPINQSTLNKQASNQQKMILSMVKDVRVILVKLADRLHNVKTLQFLSREKQLRIARETEEIYAPIASRLGIENIASELRDLCFKIRYPWRYQMLERALNKQLIKDKDYVDTVVKQIQESFGFQNVKAEIIGRVKSITSVYEKMLAKKKHVYSEDGEKALISFYNVFDIYGFRIIVDELYDCYMGIGIIHNLYKPIFKRFKDYIAIPKNNGYQSIHTTVVGPKGFPIEMQIRTRDMDLIASRGIAAHYAYKERTDSNIDTSQYQYWLSTIIDSKGNSENPEDFINFLKTDLEAQEIYVFTPNYEILTLPKGASVLDFAYAIHTDVGNKCVGCKINQEVSPISTKLSNSMVIEIITDEKGTPKQEWLNFCVTSKAIYNINNYFAKQHNSSAIQVGQEIFDKALKYYNQEKNEKFEKKLKNYIQAKNLKNEAEFFRYLAHSNNTLSIVGQLLGHEMDIQSSSEYANHIYVTNKLYYQQANCCKPIPSDKIMAILVQNKGLVLHKVACSNIKTYLKNPQHKFFEAIWSEDLDKPHTVSIGIDIPLHFNVLSSIIQTLVEKNAIIKKIDNINTTDILVYHLDIQIKDRAHLAAVFKAIRSQIKINKIYRL